MKAFHAIVKRPGNNPEVKRVEPTTKSISKILGGAFYAIRIKLTTGKSISVFYNQEQPILDYNFTICPSTEKKTYIDICGPVIVFGSDGDNIINLEMTPAEKAELFAVPYDK